MILLQTEDLLLRNAQPEDLQALYEIIFNDKDVTKYTFGNDLETKEQIFDFMQNNLNFNEKLGLSTLVLKQTNEIIGLAGAIQCNYLNQTDYEIGFILATKYWGRGFALQIGSAQIKYIKDVIKANRAVALAEPNNEASIKAIKRLGFTYLQSIKTKKGLREFFTLEF